MGRPGKVCAARASLRLVAAVVLLVALICSSAALGATRHARSHVRQSHVRSHARPLHARAGALSIFRHARRLSHPRRMRHRRAGAHAAVVGGTLTTIQQVPWQVTLLGEVEYEFEEGETFVEVILCGGSIVDMTHIVTAAHCVVDPETGEPLPTEDFFVVAGASTLTEEELEEGETVEESLVEGIRVHPGFDVESFESGPDDVAVLNVESLTESEAVKPIALPSSPVPPAEGSTATLSGFGLEMSPNPPELELDGMLHSLHTTLTRARRCGGEADAVFLCSSSPAGTACFGDSGGGLVAGGTLIGVTDAVSSCAAGALDAFANVTAPEIESFIKGSEHPPLAPRGGGIVVRGITSVGNSLTCQPGSWTNASSFSYSFIDTRSELVLQHGPSATYLLAGTDVGRTIACEVEVQSAGGTARARTGSLPAIAASAPPGGEQRFTSPGAILPLPTGPETGGTLSFKTIGPSQIAELLEVEITPSSKQAKIAKVLGAHGLTLPFKALEAGSASVAWYEVPKGARLARRAKPVLVASGSASFSTAETAQIRLTLTRAGKRLLAHAHRLKLVAKGTFKPRGEKAISVKKAFVLHR